MEIGSRVGDGTKPTSSKTFVAFSKITIPIMFLYTCDNLLFPYPEYISTNGTNYYIALTENNSIELFFTGKVSDGYSDSVIFGNYHNTFIQIHFEVTNKKLSFYMQESDGSATEVPFLNTSGTTFYWTAIGY